MKSHINMKEVDAYLRDEMSPARKQDFEERLISDQDLREEVDRMRIMIDVLISEDVKRLSDRLDSFDLNTPSRGRRIIIRAVLAVAASVLLLLVTNVYRGGGSRELYDEYYQPYSNQLTQTVRGATQSDSDIVKAFEQYDLGNYDEALSLMVALMNEKSPVEMYFYMGICSLETGDYSSSEKYLKTYLQQGEILTTQAKWYMSMLYLKQDKIEMCKNHLQDLHKTGRGFYQEKSADLLAKLD